MFKLESKSRQRKYIVFLNMRTIVPGWRPA